MLCWKSGLLYIYALASSGHVSPRYVLGEIEGRLMAPRSHLGFFGLIWFGARVPTLCAWPGRGVVDDIEVVFGALWALRLRTFRTTELGDLTFRPRKASDIPENVAHYGRYPSVKATRAQRGRRLRGFWSVPRPQGHKPDNKRRQAG